MIASICSTQSPAFVFAKKAESTPRSRVTPGVIGDTHVRRAALSQEVPNQLVHARRWQVQPHGMGNGGFDLKQRFLEALAPISFAIKNLQLKKPCPMPLSLDPDEPLAFRVVQRTDKKKLEMAQQLSDWLISEMQKQKVSVAVVARGGTWQTKTQDRTYMEHAGILIYDPKLKRWVIYDLVNNDCAYPQRADLWRNDPVDFFYSQPNYDWDALVMIPELKLRKAMREAMLKGQYKQLYFTRDYNLVTTYNSRNSLNCNKWVLMNVVAAKIGSYDPAKVIEAIDHLFEPAVINIHPMLRHIAKQHPTVLQEEVPHVDPIKTVTVESLYRSPLFEKRAFYSGKSLDSVG